MSISDGIIAFLQAVGGERSAPGRSQDAAQSAPPAASPPLVQLVEALVVRMTAMEGELKGLKSFVTEEVDRANRAAERVRSSTRRLVERLEGVEQLDPDSDVPGFDVPAGIGSRVLPMHGRMEEPPAPLTPEQVRAAARRAIAAGEIG